jgi:hypothetical protein
MSEFWTGVWTGILSYMFVRWVLRQIVVSIVVSHIKEIKEQQEGEVLLKLEKVGEMIYCYRKDTDEFICQAKTLQEVADIFKQRFPNSTARILQEDASGVTI